MHKCGICGKEIEKRPKVTNDGKCSQCCENLKMKEKHEEKQEEF